MPIFRYSLIAISLLLSLVSAAAGGYRLAGLQAESGSLLSIVIWGMVWLVSNAVLVLELIRSERGRAAAGAPENLAEAMPVGLALYDSDGLLVSSNDVFRRTIPDPNVLDDHRDELDLGPNGWVRLLRRPLSDGGSLVVAIDITREVKFRNERRDATARLNRLVNVAADWTWETDVLHRFTTAATVDDDPNCPKLGGMIGHNLAELALDNIGANDWSAENCLREMDRHEPFQDRRLTLMLDGSVCEIHLSGVPRYDEGGEFLGYSGIGKRVAEPLAPAPEIMAHPLGSPEKAGASNRLLLVDDSLTNRLLAESILKRMGYAVTVVEGGREAIEAVRAGNYAAVLMDIWMPEMDGFEATAAIRALPPPHCEVPVIAMTAHAGDEERRRCLEAGMNEHVAKPIDRALLASVLRHFVGPASGASAARETDAEPAPERDDLVNDDVLNQLRNDAGPALVDELIGAYMAETDDRLVRMESALEARNFDEIGADAHSMKSSSGTFGALQLQELAARIEAAAMAEDFETLAESHGELPALVSATWAAFAARGFKRD